MTLPPKAVLFDCDGVVIDSEGPTLELLQADLARFGLRLTMEDLLSGFVGGTVETCATKARAAGAALPDDWVPDFYRRMYDMLRKSAPLIPGVTGVLDALDAAGIPYAMGSNGTPEKMEITLGQHGLVDRFQGHIYSGQALGRPKPAPDLYLHAAARLGVQPHDCIVIEDSAAGARAARAAGMRCMGYAPHGHAEVLANEGAVPFTDMADLPGLLGL